MFTVVWYSPERDETTEEDYTTITAAMSRMNSLVQLGYSHCWVEVRAREMSN